MQVQGGEVWIERLGAQPGQQLGGGLGVQRIRPHHGAEAARVGQPQQATAGAQIEMVMRPGWPWIVGQM